MRALLFAAPLFLLAGCTGSGPVGVDVGDRAPQLSGETAAGKPITLSQYQGKVVLLDFWASWCGPCVAEMSHTKDLHRQFDGRPFVILGVNRDYKKDDLSRYLSSNKLPWDNVYDGSGNISDQWKVSSLPTFILIDHTGTIAGRWIGGGHTGNIVEAVGKAVKAAEGK